MITLNKIVSDIQEIINSGQLNYSYSITNEQISYWIHQVRSLLIKQAIDKREDISDSWVQIIKCLEFETVDISECCDETNLTGCTILKSKKPVPNSIEVKADNKILRVTTINGQPIDKSNIIKVLYNQYNKYTAKKAQWFLKNRYLYIANYPSLEKANVYLIAEDPTELADYINCDNEECYTDNSYYPVSLKMANDITNIIIETKVKPFLSIPKDKDNDANDEVKLTK